MKKILLTFALVLLFGFAISGCGPKGPVMYEVTGKVIFKNQPLDDGIIEFHPTEGQGSKQGAHIVNGEYKVPRATGLYAGKYSVFLTGGDGTSGEGEGGTAPSKRRVGATPGKERIPPQYNVKTTQVVEVKAQGPNRFDFTIK